jgi:hypothetical protein
MSLLNRLKIKIKEKIWRNFKDSFHIHISQEPVLIRNINYKAIPFQKRALISYLTHGYFADTASHSGRTVIFEIFKIVKIFSELGYTIDLVNCNDVKTIELIKNIKYSIIFGFGDVFYLMSELQPEALTILYMTEQHPEFSFKEEQERIKYFYDRHKKNVSMERSGQFYKIQHLQRKYSQVITLSETEPLMKQYDSPYTICPTGIFNPKFVFGNKDHNSARKHFLWLGSTAVIHKGLDLLIDVFSKRKDVYLHICGLDDSARKILDIPKRHNIFDYGYIKIKSEAFLEIINLCAYSILPSCAEGCATSITTSMLHGLIPVVMRNAGFNRLIDKAIFLDDYEIEHIDTCLSKLADEEPEVLNGFSKKVFDFAHKEFTLSAYEENFRNIMIDIMTKND